MKRLHICLKVVGNAKWMGGALYTQNLVRAITSLPPEERDHIKLSLACSSPSSANIVSSVHSAVDRVYSYGYHLLRVSQQWSEKLAPLPSALFNPLNIDFVYPTEPGTRHPYHWGAWIPDFQHRHLPEFFTKEEIEKRDAHFARVAETAPITVLSSKMAQDDFNTFYPEAADRSAVMNFISYMEPAYFEANPLSAQQKYELPDRFFLVSNQLYKHKNHALIVEALGILKQRNICPTIVLTGNFSADIYKSYWLEVQSKIEFLGLSNQIKILGLIPRIDQIQLMRRCLAIIQPSLFEGWSTVVEDAKALGKSIILSNFPVHLEQDPMYGYFFDPHDAEQLAAIIHKVFDSLKPGPDLSAEKNAQDQSRSNILTHGRKFLEIVDRVLAES
jgi:glycosyltransferase involved in cell wall biosynthesis